MMLRSWTRPQCHPWLDYGPSKHFEGSRPHREPGQILTIKLCGHIFNIIRVRLYPKRGGTRMTVADNSARVRRIEELLRKEVDAEGLPIKIDRAKNEDS